MRKTDNFELNLIDAEEFVNVEDLNENARKTDEILKSLENPEYEETEELTELTSSERLSNAFGKIAKAINELISHIKDTTIHFTSEERQKLSGIATGANKTTVDTTLSSTSANPVQNNIIYAALAKKIETSKIVNNLTTTATDTVLSGPMGKQLQDNKIDKVSGKGLSTNDYTTAEKNKLAGIATGANKTTVDSALSSSSTNPVQNKVVTDQTNKLFYLVAKALEGSSLWKSVSSCYMTLDELGAVYYGYMDVNDCKNNIGKEVIVCYSNGAIGKSKITNASGYYSLEPIITWLHSSVPYVNKSTIQAGTKTLPISGTSSYGYVLPTTYGAVLEISNADNFATKYLILN